MILMRKPLRVFDVDVLGVAVLVVLGVGAYLTAVVPGRAQAKQRRSLKMDAESVEAQVCSVEERLRAIERLTRELRDVVARRVDSSPVRSEINAIVNHIVADAEQAGLRIASVEPEPAERVGDTYVSAVSVIASGRQPDCVAFLDALAMRHPYHSIESLSLVRQPDLAEFRCRIVLRVWLHVLPDEMRLAKGDRP